MICRCDHPALTYGGLDLHAWLEAGHIVVRAEPDGPTAVDRTLEDQGLRRHVVARVENALLVPHLVATTQLVAMLDSRLARRVARPGLVVLAPPLALPMGSRVRMVWSERRAHDPALIWLRNGLTTLCATPEPEATTPPPHRARK